MNNKNTLDLSAEEKTDAVKEMTYNVVVKTYVVETEAVQVKLPKRILLSCNEFLRSSKWFWKSFIFASIIMLMLTLMFANKSPYNSVLSTVNGGMWGFLLLNPFIKNPTNYKPNNTYTCCMVGMCLLFLVTVIWYGLYTNKINFNFWSVVILTIVSIPCLIALGATVYFTYTYLYNKNMANKKESSKEYAEKIKTWLEIISLGAGMIVSFVKFIYPLFVSLAKYNY